MDISNKYPRSLEILPEEMWKKIFSDLYSSKSYHPSTPDNKRIKEATGTELLRCSRVCKDFERTLKPDESTWLFKEVRFCKTLSAENN